MATRHVFQLGSTQLHLFVLLGCTYTTSTRHVAALGYLHDFDTTSYVPTLYTTSTRHAAALVYLHDIDT